MSDLAQTPTASRAEPFGYRCGRCQACCHHFLVPLSPYAAARLARALGIPIVELARRYTRRGLGRELAHTEAGACVFLEDGLCSVYADRPLACRLYPLWRGLDAEGREVWRGAPPLPQT